MRLIDADALAIDLHEWQMEAASRGLLNDYEVLDKVLSVLDDPRYTIDPVRHGRWLQTDAWPHNVYCSECHKTVAQAHWKIWQDGSFVRNYCPNCGARMDGGEDE